jgi:hypothetical protein
MDIVTGERIQEIADVYFCNESYIGSYTHNDYIISQNKHKFINSLREYSMWDNPSTIFCYADWLHEFSNKLDLFKNPFTLVTHNSDYNITSNETCLKVLEHPKIIHWYAQNVCMNHPKLRFLPIGIANRQWQHGSLFVEFYKGLNVGSLISNKKYDVYFNFQVSTNFSKRQPCYDALSKKLEFLPGVSAFDNFARLSQYKFCICPEGNGADTHRLWEALYLKCVPIVLDSPFIRALQSQANLPLVIINCWEDFRMEDLPPYESFDFECTGIKTYLSCKELYNKIVNETIIYTTL